MQNLELKKKTHTQHTNTHTHTHKHTMSIRRLSRKALRPLVNQSPHSTYDGSTPVIGAHITEYASDDDSEEEVEPHILRRRQARAKQAAENVVPKNIVTMDEYIEQDDMNFLTAHENEDVDEKERQTMLQQMLYALPFGKVRREHLVHTDANGNQTPLFEDPAFMLHGVRKNVAVLDYASHHLLNSPRFLLQAVRHDARSLLRAPALFQRSEKFLKHAIKTNRWAMKYVTDAMKRNKEFVLSIMRMDGTAIGGATQEMQRDKDVLLEALRQNTKAIDYVSKDILRDPSIRHIPEVSFAIDDSDTLSSQQF